ncbi:unnamed protein product [Heterotrigona itama]|uniref:Uncharacterized protein n=1 Tax=Heterotrigona itama TaxID=395501 RepID=A0A6V7H058_9HYME|nr:unnamed protein product [Heterotrigona itama]
MFQLTRGTTTTDGFHIYPCRCYSKTVNIGQTNQWRMPKTWNIVRRDIRTYVPDKEYNPICSEASHRMGVPWNQQKRKNVDEKRKGEKMGEHPACAKEFTLACTYNANAWNITFSLIRDLSRNMWQLGRNMFKDCTRGIALSGMVTNELYWEVTEERRKKKTTEKHDPLGVFWNMRWPAC